jgi:hypothetical protein
MPTIDKTTTIKEITKEKVWNWLTGKKSVERIKPKADDIKWLNRYIKANN